MRPQGASPYLAATFAGTQLESSNAKSCHLAPPVLATRQFFPLSTVTVELSPSSTASETVSPAGLRETGALRFSARIARRLRPDFNTETTFVTRGCFQFAPEPTSRPFTQVVKRSSAAIRSNARFAVSGGNSNSRRKKRDSMGASNFGSPSGYQIQSPNLTDSAGSAQLTVPAIGFNSVHGT